MNKYEKKEKEERIRFFDILAVKQATKGSYALLKKRKKEHLIELPNGLDFALNLIKCKGFSLVQIK